MKKKVIIKKKLSDNMSSDEFKINRNDVGAVYSHLDKDGKMVYRAGFKNGAQIKISKEAYDYLKKTL